MRLLPFMSRLGLLLVFAVVAGCGGQRQGKVIGQVTYEGKALPGGWILFRPADARKNAVPVALDEQGHFEAVLPAGEVQVSVDNRELEPQTQEPAGGSGIPPALLANLSPEAKKALNAEKAEKAKTKRREGAQKGSSRYVKIPDRYYDVAKSNLTFTVEGGDQKKDFELTK
jgi:hypothetical protein